MCHLSPLMMNEVSGVQLFLSTQNPCGNKSHVLHVLSFCCLIFPVVSTTPLDSLCIVNSFTFVTNIVSSFFFFSLKKLILFQSKYDNVCVWYAMEACLIKYNVDTRARSSFSSSVDIFFEFGRCRCIWIRVICS